MHADEGRKRVLAQTAAICMIAIELSSHAFTTANKVHKQRLERNATSAIELSSHGLVSANEVHKQRVEVGATQGTVAMIPPSPAMQKQLCSLSSGVTSGCTIVAMASFGV